MEPAIAKKPTELPVERAAPSPALWIDAAMDMLVDGGVDLVRVDVIARTVGVTRGSFYWHFKDREDLLGRVLAAWSKFATEQVTDRVAHHSDDPKALIHELANLPLRGRSARRAARIELAIRDWARRDAMARKAVSDADAFRVGYIAQCFSALGFGLAEARHRATLLYASQLGESLLADLDIEQREKRVAFAEQLLLSPVRAG